MNKFCPQWLKYFLAIVFVLMSAQAMAVLHLELTQGEIGALPIAIVPFLGQSSDDQNAIANVVSNDLQNSGRFRVYPISKINQMSKPIEKMDFGYWRNLGSDNVVVGEVKQQPNGKYNVEFFLLDIYKVSTNDPASKKRAISLTQHFDVEAKDLRRLAHHISDLIYQKLIGQKGVFSTHIAYIIKTGDRRHPTYRLEVADADGYNPHVILTSREPIMSPAWSHNSKYIAYVSFENRKAQIYITNVATGQRRLVSDFPGINGAPAWSPDDKKLAVVLSLKDVAHIYILDLDTNTVRQVTSGEAIDTEPNWSPDGQSLIFTSDRSGSPQIYQIALNGGQVKRLTFDGGYNARASFTSDGQKIVMLHRAPEGYTIGIQKLASGEVQLLTRSGRDESPSVAPNGSMVLFGNEYGVLGLASTDGSVHLTLPAREGQVQSPAWSGY